MSQNGAVFEKTPGYYYFCATLETETRVDPRVFWLALSDAGRLRYEISANMRRRIYKHLCV